MKAQHRTIAGKAHTLVVLKVTASDAQGRPSACVVGYDDTVFQLEGGEEFVTAWVPLEVVDRVRS